MYYPMDLKYNPTGEDDIDAERERREESLEELKDGVTSFDSFEGEEEEFDSQPGPELEALLPYYNRVEEEALKIAKKYFQGFSWRIPRMYIIRNSLNISITNMFIVAMWIFTTRTMMRLISSR